MHDDAIWSACSPVPDAGIGINPNPFPQLKDEYLKQAQKVIQDPNILVNVVSRRVKQLKHGSRPLVESLERLNPEDIALREIIEGKITYQLYNADDPLN